MNKKNFTDSQRLWRREGGAASHAAATAKAEICRGPVPFCGFSAGNRLLCGAIAASTGALWRKYCPEWSEVLGGGGAAGYGAGGGRVLPLPLVMDLSIFGFRGKNTRAQKFSLCCYR